MKFEKIDFTCPNCDTYYVVYDGKPISEKKYHQLKHLTEEQLKKGHCKHCVRKDPNTPTTLEMDGILTKEDIKTRNDVVFQCRKCKKWTLHKNYVSYGQNSFIPCTTRGETDYDPTSIKSFRSFNAETDNKRKPKVKK